MPYSIAKRTGKRPWKIIRRADRHIVGTSTSKKKALASIAYREDAESKKK